MELSAVPEAEMECRSGDVRGNPGTAAAASPAAACGHDHRFVGLAEAPPATGDGDAPADRTEPTEPPDSMDAVDHLLFLLLVRLAVDAPPSADDGVGDAL